MSKPNRRNRKRSSDAVPFPTAAKGRWNPQENTRSQTFANRKAVANRNACRGKVAWNG